MTCKTFVSLALAVLVWNSCNVLAQSAHNYLGICFGGSNLHLQDQHASPLIFRSNGIAPSLQFIHQSDVYIHFAEVSFAYNKLKALPDNFTTQHYAGRVRYALMTNLFRSTERLHIYAGGSIQSFFNRSDYSYTYLTIPNVRAITSWYWSHSFDLASQVEYSFAPRKFISARLFIPLISNVSRPEYSPSGDYNYTTNSWDMKTFGKTVFLTDNLSFNAHIAYQTLLAEKFNLQLSYEFQYVKYTKPVELKMYSNAFRIGLFYCF